jgi:hypothetical protein
MSATCLRCPVCSRTTGPDRPQRRRRPRDGADALGNAAATQIRRATRDQHPQHVVTALARVAEAEKLVPGASQQFRRIRTGAEPGDQKKDEVWFALNDDRPLAAFAGIWTTFNGDRGTKSKPVPGPHQVYGFLTTSQNAIVKPIHPKAMPVILTTDESATSGCARRGMKRRHCSDRCRTIR